MGKSTVEIGNALGDIYLNESLGDLATRAYLAAIEIDPAQDASRPLRAAELLAARGMVAGARQVIERFQSTRADGAGALPEAAERLARVNAELPARMASAPTAFDSVTALARASAKRRFYVHSSLPHNGYMGVQMHATGVWPAGSTGWLALVELIEPGVRDTQVPRRLVRVLVGPLNLPAGPGARNAVAPLYGLRWPENAHAENLVATAWVEDASGRITQVATDRCADPK